EEMQIGQTFGADWGSGSGLITYEYYDRSELSASDRSYTRSSLLPFSLLPQQDRQSAFGTVRQMLSDTVELFADANYADRDSVYDVSNSFFSLHYWQDSETYSG